MICTAFIVSYIVTEVKCQVLIHELSLKSLWGLVVKRGLWRFASRDLFCGFPFCFNTSHMFHNIGVLCMKTCTRSRINDYTFNNNLCSLCPSTTLHTSSNVSCHDVFKVQQWFNEHIHHWKTENSNMKGKCSPHRGLSDFNYLSGECIFTFLSKHCWPLRISEHKNVLHM